MGCHGPGRLLAALMTVRYCHAVKKVLPVYSDDISDEVDDTHVLFE